MTEKPMAATAFVEVEVDPATAFDIFTSEIDLWWVRGPINFHDSGRLAELRMEPGVGGRVLEIYDEAAGDLLETARITLWEPGERLMMRGTVGDTETDIRFEKTGTGTRVRVRQYLVEGGDPRTVGFGWVTMSGTFEAWVARRDVAPKTPREIGRLGLALYYKDPVGAARWLMDAFGLGSWDVDRPPADDDLLGWLEFHVGDNVVMLFPLEGEKPAVQAMVPWVFVDDLAQHLARAKERGAEIIQDIRSHGYSSYVAADLEGYHWTFCQARPTM